MSSSEPAGRNVARIDTPFHITGAVVRPEWIDHNGHLNVAYYHLAFDQSVTDFFAWLGLTPEYRNRRQASTFALESHLHFVREVKLGDPLRFEAWLLACDGKRIHFYQEMFHAQDRYLAATHESLAIHMDMVARRTAPMPPELADRMQAVARAHAVLERSWRIGHVIGTSVPR